MAKKLDNRMGWIRNLESLSESEDGSSWHEYEIASECFIAGELNYSRGKIYCKFLTLEKDKDGLYRYLLCMQYRAISFKNNGEKKGYYFIDGPCGEILALFSIFFQCRFYLVSIYTPSVKIKKYEDFLYRKPYALNHPEIFNANDCNRNFAEGLNNFPASCDTIFNSLSDFLDSIKKLSPEKHQSFILACWHYARSLKEVGLDREMVFIRLVSAIEALSKDYDKIDDPLDGAAFDELFKGADLIDEQRDRLREILRVGKKGKIRIDKNSWRFREFIKRYSNEFAYTQPAKEVASHGINRLYVTQENLEEVLKLIYSARSKYLHEGEPMHLSELIVNELAKKDINWDFWCSVGGIIDNRSFGSTQLPYECLFERLVRHCLLKWFENNLLS